MLQVLVGVGFVLMMTCGGFTCLCLLIPVILTLPIPSIRVIRYRRKLVAWASALYFDFAAALLTEMCKVKIHVYSNAPELIHDKGMLLMCNHRTRIDWMFSGWCYAALIKANDELRVILKDSLKSVPVYGWAMQLMMYFFLSRKKENDVPYLSRKLSYLLDAGDKPIAFLFPEGTDLSPSNVEKSNQFARENNLPETQQVLQPKIGGLAALLNCLRGRGLAIHDVTIGYKDHKRGKRASDVGLLKGEFPAEVHLCVKRYEIDSLPSDRNTLEKWLRDIFVGKERMLSTFYENNSSPTFGTGGGLQSDSVWPAELTISANPTQPLVIVCGLLLLNVVLLVVSSVWRWICALLVIICIASTAAGGFDRLEMYLHGEMLAQAAAHSPTQHPTASTRLMHQH
jgi:lysocardiolipin and lysophospholipid acyltransferase